MQFKEFTKAEVGSKIISKTEQTVVRLTKNKNKIAGSEARSEIKVEKLQMGPFKRFKIQ